MTDISSKRQIPVGLAETDEKCMEWRRTSYSRSGLAETVLVWRIGALRLRLLKTTYHHGMCYVTNITLKEVQRVQNKKVFTSEENVPGSVSTRSSFAKDVVQTVSYTLNVQSKECALHSTCSPYDNLWSLYA